METCNFLDRLPLEIRFRVYELCLTYSGPIKIRYILPSSKDLPLLRLNRQIYSEAIMILYERNRVAIKWSHFCKLAPSDIKAPIDPRWIRHLLIDGIGSSLICGRKDDLDCSVCSGIEPDDLYANLNMFPRLKTVVFNYRGYMEEMDGFRERVEQTHDLKLVNSGLVWPPAYVLQGSKLRQVSVQFRYGLSEWVDHAIQGQIDCIRNP